MVLHVFRISSTTFQIPNVLGIYADISPTIYSIALASFVYGSNSSTSSPSFSLLLPFSAFFPTFRARIRSFLIEIVLPAHFNFLLNTAILKIVCWLSFLFLSASFTIDLAWFIPGIAPILHFDFISFVEYEKLKFHLYVLKGTWTFLRIKKRGLTRFTRFTQCVNTK